MLSQDALFEAAKMCDMPLHLHPWHDLGGWNGHRGMLKERARDKQAIGDRALVRKREIDLSVARNRATLGHFQRGTAATCAAA